VTEKLQPGDIWKHQGLGMLYVTSEDMDSRPGYLKCYWRMSGEAGLSTFMDPTKTANLTLMQRLGEQGPDGEWRLKPR
jgi:hypothetical protein